MPLNALKLIISFLVVFSLSTPAFPGTLNIWVDENGVTHMSEQPPPDDTQYDEIKFKEKKDPYKLRRDNFQYLRKMEDRRNVNIRRLRLERETEKRKKDRKKRKQKAELDSAKRDYEYLKSNERLYREYYHDASSRGYRDYWRDELKRIDEAENNYRKLKNKYGE